MSWLPFDDYGKGYGWEDMRWLWRKMEQVYAVGDTPDIEALMTELDQKRGGPPEWRKGSAS